MGYGDESVVVYSGKLVDNIKINVVKERMMNKKELKRRGKGLLALMLAFMMMFGSSMTVFAGNTHWLEARCNIVKGKPMIIEEPARLTVGDILQGGDTIQNKTESGSLIVRIDGRGQNSEKHTVQGQDHFYFDLPTGYNYQVEDYRAWLQDGSYVTYSVELSTVPITPSGGTEGTGNTSTESNSDDTKSGNVSPELSEEEQYIARLRSEYWENHVHTFSWVTTREAAAGQDGIQENRCSCGLVQDTTVIPASQTFVQEYYDVVRNAPVNGTVSYDSGSLHTLSDRMLKYLSERSDVTVEVSFVYEGTAYKMTIPAGCDYSALLSDEDAFYGYFYFAQQTGAKIEPVA